ncbi:hypothetical protein D9758_009857 [Tetrapyrgos nigripes]|uniref:Uncharacterized protein n=1 Tax=Tetrapyrgos nigripes TaxID=182062 RepID=A0A8H5LSF7_9AGAR|nr:hypothetical protein D9758_009857 [Tetrapyrgos nigripes]
MAVAANPSYLLYSSPSQYELYAYPPSTYTNTVYYFVPLPYPTAYVPQQTGHSTASVYPSNDIDHTYGPRRDSQARTSTSAFQYFPYPQATSSHSTQKHARRPSPSIQPTSFHRNSYLEMEISPTSPQGARLIRKRLACEAKVQTLEANYEKEREKAAVAEKKAKILEFKLGVLRYEAQLGSERVVELERKLGGLKEEMDSLKKELQDSQRDRCGGRRDN